MRKFNYDEFVSCIIINVERIFARGSRHLAIIYFYNLSSHDTIELSYNEIADGNRLTEISWIILTTHALSRA